MQICLKLYLNIRWWLFKLLHTIAGVSVGVPQQRDIVCCWGLQAVAHPSDPGKHCTNTTGEAQVQQKLETQ